MPAISLPESPSRAACPPTPTTYDLTTGDLLVQGPHLLYAPTGDDQAMERSLKKAGIRFLWDLERNQGWVLSEALQGYAPIKATAQITNVSWSVSKPVAEKVEGYRCEQQDVTVSLNDGSAAVYRVWRALDMPGVPVQVTSLGSTAPFLLKFSKFRPEVPPTELFQLPGGFTKFPNSEGLLSELLMRQHNLKRKSDNQRGEPLTEDHYPERRY